jgi:hypothetical protein
MYTSRIRALLIACVVLCITAPTFIACAAQGDNPPSDKMKDEPAPIKSSSIDWHTRIIAYIGATLGIATIVWDILKYRESKDQDKEKVSVGLSIVNRNDIYRQSLTAHIINERPFRIPIQDVWLHFPTLQQSGPGALSSAEGVRGSKTGAIFTTMVNTDLPGSGPLGGRTTGYARSCDLEERKQAIFFLSLQSQPLVQYLLSLPTSKLWISVYSYKGEIAKVPGSDIQAELRKHFP